MLKLVRLYSEDERFREIKFKSGINIIRGDSSINDQGEVTSYRQNGVGKSFTVELIDFCLLRTYSESKINKIREKYFPLSSFVYLHFIANGRNFVIARNRKGDIKIKKENETFREIGLEDARKYLALITGLEGTPLTFRDFMNFFIKHEDYLYTSFNQLYKGTYAELMKIHFYLFDISLDVLVDIVGAFRRYDAATERRRDVTKKLNELDLDIDQLRAKKNELEQRVERIEEGLDYSNFLEDYDTKQKEITELEKVISDKIDLRNQLLLDLSELSDYISDYADDIYINDSDIKSVFNKYQKGLGDLVVRDIDDLYKFRDQLAEFKTTITAEKKKQIQKEVTELDDFIATESKKVESFYSNISESNKNAIVKSFRIYQTDLSSTQEYDSYINMYDESQKEILRARTDYAVAISRLNGIIDDLKVRKDSFETDFLDIHRSVTGSDSASFDFSVNADSAVTKKTDFFRFSVEVETGGSRGSNQLRAAIYDATIQKNSYTQPRTLDFVVHDNLVFGTMDKESSINFLNYMSTFSSDNLQYIATVNNDDFDYMELRDRFKFDIEKDVVINLTKSNPLFHEIYSDFIKE